MQFIYVFLLMFISIFGLAVLLHLLWSALLDGSVRKFDIYVRNSEDIGELLENIGKNPNIGRVYIIADKPDSGLARLSEKYGDVKIIGKER